MEMNETWEHLHWTIEKCNGRTAAVGDSAIDKERLENLEQKCKLIDRLVSDILHEASNRHSKLGSVKRSGDKTVKFLTSLRDEINEDLPWPEEGETA